MAEPAVCLGPVPVLYSGGDRYHVAGLQASGGFALLLIPALPVHTEKQLPAAGVGVVDVPVVAAARLKGHIGDKYGLGRVGQGL